MNLRNILLLTLALAGVELHAQHVSEAEARDKALRFLSPMMRARGESVAMPDLQLAHQALAGETTCYYVYNEGEGHGFVIVAGDRVAADILGYSEEGSFDPALMPDNMRYWLEQYQQQIALAAAHGVTDPEAQSRLEQQRASMRRIEPLMAGIEWTQHRPHNLLIDERENDVPVGCVTTATTQVMYYYRWPRRDHDLRFDAQRVELTDGRQIVLPAIDRDYTYDWNSFAGYYDQRADYAAANSLTASAANLGYRMSRAIESKYDKDGTAASFMDAGSVMINHFDYSRQMRHCWREYYSDYDWEQLVYGELAEGRPVLYDGKDALKGSGHAFVCDGYDGAGRFSINWGWGGYCNGYFLLTPVNGQTALTPEGSGTGGAGNGAQYTNNQSALLGVKPDGGEDWPLYLEGRIDELDKTSVAVGGELTATGKYVNKTFGTLNPFIGLCLQDKMDVTRRYYVGQQVFSLRPNYYRSSCSDLIIPGEVLANRTYRVQPAYKDAAGQWQLLASPVKTSSLELTVTSGSSLVAQYDPVIENGGKIVGADFTVKVAVRNPTNTAISGLVRVYIYRVNDEDNSPCAYWDVSQREFAGMRTVEETLSTSNLVLRREMPLDSYYYLRLYDSKEGHWISNRIGFALLDPTGIAEVKADEAPMTLSAGIYRVDGRPDADDARGLVIRHGRVEFRR